MIIYKTTNLINGKIYVGYDTKNDQDYYGSGKTYKLAEKKYGKQNFRKAIVDYDDDFSALCQKEIFWIDFYDSKNPEMGYNILDGGQGHKGSHSEETKRKIGAANSGRIASEETKRKLSLSHMRIKQSIDTIRKRVEKTKGMKRTDEFRAQCALRAKGNSNAKGKSSKHKGRTWIIENGKRLWKEVEFR